MSTIAYKRVRLPTVPESPGMQGLAIRQKANLYKATLNTADLTGAYVYDAIMPNGTIHV